MKEENNPMRKVAMCNIEAFFEIADQKYYIGINGNNIEVPEEVCFKINEVLYKEVFDKE